MRIVHIGFAISDQMFDAVLATDTGMPTQTQTFGWSLVACLLSAGSKVRLISAEPATDFPANSRIWIRGRWFEQGGVRGRSVSFLNVTGLKHWTRYRGAVRAARGLKSGDIDGILVHGVHSGFLWASVRLARRMNVPAVVVITDMPSTPTALDGPVRLFLKRLDRRLISAAVARMAGAVVLAPDLASEVAPGRPYMVMEGIALDGPARDSSATGGDPVKVVYAGGLKEEYGVLDLVESVAHAVEPWTLLVYGRGPAEAAVERAAAACDRISYGGFLPPREMNQVYADADVLVNPRPPHSSLASRSFPSKLLAYIASASMVVTTEIPTLPHDYRDFVVTSGGGPQALAAAIDGVARLSAEERRELGSRAREFILATRGVEAQGQRIISFIKSLV